MLLVRALINWGIIGGLLAHGDEVVGSGCGNIKVALARQGAATACDSFRSGDSSVDDMLFVFSVLSSGNGTAVDRCRAHNQLNNSVACTVSGIATAVLHVRVLLAQRTPHLSQTTNKALVIELPGNVLQSDCYVTSSNQIVSCFAEPPNK